MATKWKIDPAHSEIYFKVKHLMITTVTGYFRQFEGELVTETDDFNTTSSIHFAAKIDSIDTNNADRDKHLRSPEFFDGGQFESLTFTATRFDALQEDATVQGDLTIKGVTQPVSLEVEFGGEVTDSYGQHKAGFAFSSRISRKAFGLTWNAVTEAGSVVVSDEVRLHGDVQLIQQA